MKPILPKCADLRDRIVDRLFRQPAENPSMKYEDLSSVLGVPVAAVHNSVKNIDNGYVSLIPSDNLANSTVIFRYASGGVDFFLKEGGYSKIEFRKGVTKDELLELLSDIYESKDNETSLYSSDRDFQYCRKRKIIEIALSKELIYHDKDSSSKWDDCYKLTSLGKSVYHDSGMLSFPTPENQLRPIIQGDYVIGDKVEGVKSVGNKNRNAVTKDNSSAFQNRKSDSKPWWKNFWTQLLIGAILLFISWFFGCNH